MFDSPLGDVPAATDAASDAGQDVSSDSSVLQELPDAATQELASDASSTQEQSQTQEAKPEAQDDPADSKDVKAVRDWGRSLEKDIKGKFQPIYAGIEKTASDLFGSASPEDIKATIQTVQAAAPLLKVVLDPQASGNDVVTALRQALPSEHLESVAWAALNDPATQDVIFSDPEVLQTISEKLFDGRSLEDVKALLADAPTLDPEREAWRKEQSDFKAEQVRARTETAQQVAQKQSTDLLARFFETPAQRVIADDFKLVAPEGASDADKQLFADTAEDIRYAAQGRFLKANMDAYMQIDALYRAGKGLQAQAAEIRLQNRYEATLIKTAERHANLLKSRSAATVNGQQTKINGVRPDVKGSVEGNGHKAEERWDIDAPDFAQKFAASFHN